MKKSLHALLLLFFAVSLRAMEERKEVECPYEHRDEVGTKAQRTYPQQSETLHIGAYIVIGGHTYSLRTLDPNNPLQARRFGVDLNSVGGRRKLEEYFKTHDIDGQDTYVYRREVQIDGLVASMRNQVIHYEGDKTIWKSKFFLSMTYLQIAAAEGDWDAIEYLLAHDANPEGTTEEVAFTPLELLINLVRWEQEMLGTDDLDERKEAAEQFVRAEWSRILQAPRASNNAMTRFRDGAINELVTHPIRDLTLLMCILVALYLTQNGFQA